MFEQSYDCVSDRKLDKDKLKHGTIY